MVAATTLDLKLLKNGAVRNHLVNRRNRLYGPSVSFALGLSIESVNSTTNYHAPLSFFQPHIQGFSTNLRGEAMEPSLVFV